MIEQQINAVRRIRLDRENQWSIARRVLSINIGPCFDQNGHHIRHTLTGCPHQHRIAPINGVRVNTSL